MSDICIVAAVYNKLGGIERYNVELADALVKQGHPVSLVATAVDYPTNNLAHVTIVRTKWIFPSLTFLANAVKVSFIYRRFKKEHPDGLFIADGLPSFFCDFMIAQSV